MFGKNVGEQVIWMKCNALPELHVLAALEK